MRKLLSFVLFPLLLTGCMKEKQVTITVQNQSVLNRINEMVEVDWKIITDKLSIKKNQSFIVLDEQGQQVPYQLVTYGKDVPAMLIFQANLDPQQNVSYIVKAGVPDSFPSLVNVRFLSQKKDDIAWENDRIAYRMYGGALEMDPQQELISGGIDIWVKKTPQLLTSDWYKDDLARVETNSQPSGKDFYSVANSFGSGGAAPFQNDSVYPVSHNFKSYEILDNGPLRCVFRLTYQPYYSADSVLVNETRTISLDAGSNLNKITEEYGDIKNKIQIAAGFPYYGNNTYELNAPQGYMAYAQPEDSIKGTIYLGIVSDVALIDTRILGDQLLAIMKYDPSYMAGKGLIYYSGGGWSKGGFPTFESWDAYIRNFALLVRHPLIIGIE